MTLHINQERLIHFIKYHQLWGIVEPRFGYWRINMKYLWIAFLIAAVAAQALGKHVSEEYEYLMTENGKVGLFDADSRSPRHLRSYTSQLHTFLDVKLRKLLKEGNATLGVPIMDPLDKPELAIELDEKKAKVNVSINNLHVEGLTDYKVDTAKVSIFPTKITVGLTFPEIKPSGKYSVKGVVMDGVNVYGDGEFQVNIKNFSVQTVVAVSLENGIKVKSIKLEISLGGLELKATGIFNDENTSILLSEIISDMAPQLISDYHDEITTNVSAFLVEIANVFLNGKHISDITAILG
ncbi:uncharacterized protein LOC107041736 [Diachasma alloeum]|uniref:uncharacterized protein LOC107041736 n=1 Tax=Diachasma alloeum TaxID=454923 RepID=UPI0007381CDA|nr:uncharacterized protein LOC107041736 [Diachasma alloeum]